MLEERNLQMLVKELEQARADRVTVLGNRQLLIKILIAAWTVLITLLVFSLNKWGLTTVWGYFGAFCSLCLGGLVNLISIVRMIVNTGELDISRFKIRCVEKCLSSKEYFPRYWMLLNFDFGEVHCKSSSNHYSSFTPRFHFVMCLVIFGNGVISAFATLLFFGGLIKIFESDCGVIFPTYTYLLLDTSAVCLGVAWYSGMRDYYVQKKRIHNEDVAARNSKFEQATSRLVQ